MTEDRDSTGLDLATTRSERIPPSSSAPAVNARRQPKHHAGRGPIFVNSSFRTSSTWLWQKLRSTPHVTAYYEVFNEALNVLGRRDAGALSASSWASNHPHSAPYFLEYLPLLKEGGGLPAFDASMPYDRFIPAGGLEGQLSLEERLHIDTLLRAAHDNGKIPVLTCTRTLGRASALNKAFGGTSILLVRNLFHQWASYCGQAAAGNPYFLHSINKTVFASRHDPFVRNIDDWFSSRQESYDDLSLFAVFFILHLYVYSSAFESSDLVINSTTLCHETAYRLMIEDRISETTGINLNLSDAKEGFGASFFNVSDRKGFIETIDQFTKMIIGTCLSDRSAHFVETMKNEALQEWDRHEFYTGRARAIHRAEIGLVREDQLATSTQLSEQSDTWISQKASLEFTNDAITAEIARITVEWEKLNDNFNASIIERDNLQAQLIAQSKELDSARAALEESATLQHDIASVLADRDALAVRISDQAATWNDQRLALESALETALADGARLAQERSSLLGRFEEVTRERDTIRALQERGLLQSVWARLDDALRPGKT